MGPAIQLTWVVFLKHHKGNELPRKAPCCLCKIFFFFFFTTCWLWLLTSRLLVLMQCLHTIGISTTTPTISRKVSFESWTIMSLSKWTAGLLELVYNLMIYTIKPGFHYPRWRRELTARVDGWPLSITRQHGPCWWARVSTNRVDGPSTRLVENVNNSQSINILSIAAITTVYALIFSL